MKREAAKILREKEKSLEKAIKLIAKKRGYKSLMGFPYKIVDGFLYEALISTSVKDKDKSDLFPKLYIYIKSKPLLLDLMFWKVFDMYEEASKQPESFHIKGAFIANGVIIDDFYQDFFEEENQEITANIIFDKVNLIIENSRKHTFNIDTFETLITDKPNEELNKILILIIKKDFKKAEEIINNCIKREISGGFLNGQKSIIEYAKEFIKTMKAITHTSLNKAPA